MVSFALLVFFVFCSDVSLGFCSGVLSGFFCKTLSVSIKGFLALFVLSNFFVISSVKFFPVFASTSAVSPTLVLPFVRSKVLSFANSSIVSFAVFWVVFCSTSFADFLSLGNIA